MIRKSEIKYMRLAIREARGSKHEDDSIHPYVGVVVVRDGDILASACRGDRELGDHAEFTALEKKLKDEKLAGCTVYTTLEPCTTRNHPKLPCAERLIQRKVGRVVAGMLDPDQRITGQGILRLRRAGIAVDLFPQEMMAELEELNRDFTKDREAKTSNATTSPNLYSEQHVEIYSTRQEWWAINLESIISKCDKFVLIDAYQGHKHPLWSFLRKRLIEKRPFELIVACLGKDDPFFKYCLDVTKADKKILEIDIDAARKLITDVEGNHYASNKKVRIIQWKGVSPGPIACWIQGGKETIAIGLWQQLEGSTDLSPWLVIHGGPLYDTLKCHCDNVVKNASPLLIYGNKAKGKKSNSQQVDCKSSGK